MNFFITGTNTGVGKTYITSLLVRGGRRAGWGTVPMKPICCGDRDDAEVLHAACDGALPLNEINPVWFRTPVAPYTAAIVENRPVDLDLIRETFRRVQREHRSLIVEGVGGWLVPVAQDYTMADLAVELGLPVVLVVKNCLGALNHALLTIREIERSGLPFAGWILNEVEPPSDVAEVTNGEVLESFLGLPPSYRVGKGEFELDVTRLSRRL